MEEKQRYELVEEDLAYAIVDKETHKTYQQDCFDFDNICDLLNQQDKRIKELEEELEETNAGSDFIYEQSGATIKGLIKENQQLKQQLHDLPNKIVEEIKNLSIFDFKAFEESKIRRYRITETVLDTILNKYGGENE